MRWADSSDEKGDVAMKDMVHAGHNDGKVARVVTHKMMAPVPKENPCRSLKDVLRLTMKVNTKKTSKRKMRKVRKTNKIRRKDNGDWKKLMKKPVTRKGPRRKR
jgi:hypothetical protein